MAEFYIIPFMNVDGALIGNTTSNLNGLDMK